MQISKRKGYGDLKKRLADCINADPEKFFAQKAPIADADIRIWKYSDEKEKLVSSCGLISYGRNQTD